MKKIIALLAALVLCLSMVAGVAEETPKDLNNAKALLNSMYKSKVRGKLTTTDKDYTVTSQLMINGVVYPITWTVDLPTIQVVPGDNAETLIDLDDANAQDATYVLTATVTNPDGQTITVSYERIMPAMTVELSYIDIVNNGYALEAGASIGVAQRLFGTVTAIDTAYSEQYKNVSVVIQVGAMADQPILCYRLSGEGADKLAVGDEITVEGVIKNYKGTIEFDQGCKLIGFGEFVDQTAILNAAFALGTGAAMGNATALEGEVVRIKDAYSEKYGNITIVMACGDREIECYRLAGEGADKLAVGDQIAVVGTIKNYKGTIEFDQGCKLIPAGTARDVRALLKAYTTEDGKAQNGMFTLTGKLTAIKSAYSEKYGNIEVVMVVAGLEDMPMLCYRLAGEGAATLAEGDIITVSGKIKNYKGTIEFDAGCTLDAVVKAQ